MSKKTNKNTKSRKQTTQQNQNKFSGSPHDKFFKVIYSSSENALDIFRIILPKTAFENASGAN